MAVELLFGTENKAKIDQVQGTLEPLGVLVRGINELGINLEVPEDGVTAAENARAKARAYARAAGRPVFSMDNALYLDGLPDDEQPGLHVRRIPGSTGRPSDREMLNYYAKLVESHGGSMKGHWEFAVTIAAPEGGIAEATIRSPRQFTAIRSQHIVEGYPIESIQIDPASGKCIADMTAAEQAQFWQHAIGQPLMQFVGSNIGLLTAS